MSQEMKLLRQLMDLQLTFMDVCGFDVDWNNDKWEVTRRQKKKRGPAKTNNNYTNDFLEAWKPYPKRSGNNSKIEAFRAWTARINQGQKPQDMIAGVNRYAAYIIVTGKEKTEFVLMGATFFGPSLPYMEDWALPAKKVIKIKLPFSDDDLEKFAKANDLPGPGVGVNYFDYRKKLQGLLNKRANL